MPKNPHSKYAALDTPPPEYHRDDSPAYDDMWEDAKYALIGRVRRRKVTVGVEQSGIHGEKITNGHLWLYQYPTTGMRYPAIVEIEPGSEYD